jgi:hypothetical protein
MTSLNTNQADSQTEGGNSQVSAAGSVEATTAATPPRIGSTATTTVPRHILQPNVAVGPIAKQSSGGSSAASVFAFWILLAAGLLFSGLLWRVKTGPKGG